MSRPARPLPPLLVGLAALAAGVGPAAAQNDPGMPAEGGGMPQVTLLLDPQAATAASRATGRPILAIGGSTDCKTCVELIKDLQEPGDASLVASESYVVLVMDTENPAIWGRWQRTFKSDGEREPYVYVVRADGTPVYADTGTGGDLDEFLKEKLQLAGTVLSPERLAEMERAAKSIRRTRKRDPAEFTRMLVEYSNSGSYAAAALAIDKVAAEIEKEVGPQILKLQDTLRQPDLSTERRLDAAVQFVGIGREYEPLMNVKALYDDAAQTLKNEGESYGQMLDAAGLLEAGTAADEAREFRDAVASYEALVEKYPGSLAAERATAALPDARVKAAAMPAETPGTDAPPAEGTPAGGGDEPLEPATSAAANPTPKDGPKPGAEPSANDVRRAESTLRLAKRFLKSAPEKAPEYLRRVIEQAPSSDAAEEAKKLLGEDE